MMLRIKMILIQHISRESIYAPPPSSSHQAHQHWGTSPSPSEGKIAAGSLKTTTEAEVFLPSHRQTLYFPPQVQILGVAKRSSEASDGKFLIVSCDGDLLKPLMVIFRNNCVMEISFGKPMLVIDKLTAIVIMMAR